MIFRIIKNIALIIIFLQPQNLCSFNQSNGDKQLFKELEQNIFEKPFNLQRAKEILKEIRLSGRYSLIDSLVHLDNRVTNTFLKERKRTHQVSPGSIVWNIKATIIYLEDQFF